MAGKATERAAFSLVMNAFLELVSDFLKVHCLKRVRSVERMRLRHVTIGTRLRHVRISPVGEQLNVFP